MLAAKVLFGDFSQKCNLRIVAILKTNGRFYMISIFANGQKQYSWQKVKLFTKNCLVW